MSTIAAVLVLVVAVLASSLLAPRPAMAAPPLLAATPITSSTKSVLERLSMNARGVVLTGDSAKISAETWSADLTMRPGAPVSTYVQPREIVRTRGADLAGEVVSYAGEVRWGVVPSGQKVPAAGTELERQTYSPGEYPLLFTSPPPESQLDVASYFAEAIGTGPPTTTGEYFRAVTDLSNDWTLSGLQTAALIDFIQQLPDVTVEGAVIDRLGRAGIAIQTESRGDGAFRDLLIFDKSTGALLSSEQIYLGGLPGVELEAPTVLDYIAWKESQ